MTPNQLTFLLIGFTIGPEFMMLPNDLVKIAKQDSWISAFLGLIYPLYIVLIGNYIIKKFPKDNILNISKKKFGKYLGSILNFFFLLQFIFYTSAVSEEFISFSMVYIAAFLTPVKIAFVGIVLATYAAYSGLKTLGKLNEITGYLTIAIIVISLVVLRYGSLLNIQPVFGTGLQNIFKATVNTFYSYTEFEVILLLHPFVEEVSKVKGAALKAIAISGSLWIWTVFITIFYLGADIIPKTNWAFIWIFDSVNFPVINNFRYIFIFVWVMITLRMISNFLFASAFIINDCFRKDINKIYFYLSPFLFIVTIIISQDYYKINILKYLVPIFVVFNVVFITLIAIFTAVKIADEP